jgi:hypothetical protein
MTLNDQPDDIAAVRIIAMMAVGFLLLMMLWMAMVLK